MPANYISVKVAVPFVGRLEVASVKKKKKKNSGACAERVSIASLNCRHLVCESVRAWRVSGLIYPLPPVEELRAECSQVHISHIFTFLLPGFFFFFLSSGGKVFARLCKVLLNVLDAF